MFSTQLPPSVTYNSTNVRVAPSTLRCSRPRRAVPAAAGADGWEGSEDPWRSTGNNPQPKASGAARANSGAWGSSWASEARSKRKAKSSTPTETSTTQTTDPDVEKGIDAAIRSNVDRAAAMLDEIMQEIGQEVFMSEATAYLYEAPPEVTLQQAVHEAISKRMEWLDGNFLAAINAYLAAVGQQKDSPLAAALVAIRAEVLQQVADRLPAAMRVLNAALAYPRRSQRLAVLMAALEGGGRPVLPDATQPSTSAATSSNSSSSPSSEALPADPSMSADPSPAASSADGKPTAMDTSTTGAAPAAGTSSGGTTQGPPVPGATLEALAGASIQLVDDMEDQEIVADRVLLARLVLMREELRAQADKRRSAVMMGSGRQQQQQTAGSSSSAGVGSEEGVDGGFFAYRRTNLPRRCAAFLKELLAVPDRGRRMALMKKSFEEDWDFAGAPAQRRTANESPDVLRPGRFLSTLHATKQELQEAYLEGKLAGQGHEDGGARLLERLDEIELEALVVLDAIQADAGSKGTFSTGAADLELGPDYQLP